MFIRKHGNKLIWKEENERNMVKRLLKGLKKDTPIILAVIGSIGVVSTAIFAVKATPKALKLIEKRKEEENRDELEPIEVIKTVWKCYIPSTLIGVATISCIIGSYVLNKRKQVALLNSYVLLEQYFKEYKKHVKKLYGEKSDLEIRSDIAKEKFEKEHDSNKRLFFLEPYGQYFESTMEDVIMAEYNLNRKFSTKYEASLNDLLEFLGLEKANGCDEKGWTKEMICDFCNPEWIEFHHNLVTLDDGMECCIIYTSIEPHFIYDEFPPDYLPF